MKDTDKLVQELTEGRIGRRDFIRRALVLGISLSGIESLLAACGSSGNSSNSSNSTTLGYAN